MKSRVPVDGGSVNVLEDLGFSPARVRICNCALS
jgi:hypothetical protein